MIRTVVPHHHAVDSARGWVVVGAAFLSMATVFGVALAMLLLSLALFVPFVFLAPYAEAQGIGGGAAVGLVGVIGGASVVGRLVIGTFGDRIGHLAAFRVCFLVMGASFGLWLVEGSYVMLVLFAAVFGLGYGGFVALGPAVIAALFGTEGLGGLIGLVYTSAAFGSLIGPPLAGLVIGVSSYAVAIGLFGVVGMAAWATLRGVRLPPVGALGE